MKSASFAVYQLDINHDDPRIERFALADRREPSLLGSRGWHHDDRLTDFYPYKPVQADWTPPPLRKVWRPLRVIGRIRAWNDFPKVMEIPAFSQRAVDALRDILEPNGELLPLAYDYGQWWAYNLLTVADLVDVDQSTPYDSDRESKEVFRLFTHYVLREDCIRDLLIFRLRQDPSGTYVTQPFVDRVRQAGLRNFVFRRIWPWPKGTIWTLENNQLQKQKRREEGTPELRRHSVVIRLITGGKGKPNKQQREHVEVIMDSLDALLADPHAPCDAPVFGNLQGDEPVKGEHRLFLCCPDADRLVERLRPWLRHLDWPGSVAVVKRYGDMYDEAAPEETLTGPW